MRNNNNSETGALLTLSINYRHSLAQWGSFHARQGTGQQYDSYKLHPPTRLDLMI